LTTNALIRWQRRFLNAFGFTLAIVQQPGVGSIILMAGYEFGVMFPDTFRADAVAEIHVGLLFDVNIHLAPIPFIVPHLLTE
jgi:hypothetical protein